MPEIAGKGQHGEVRQMAIGADMRDVSGVRTEIHSGGEGRPLLFLHGGHGLTGHEAFLAGLATSFRVMAPAHPGFGDTEWPTELRAIGDLAYFHLDLTEQFELEDAVLVGEGFGGWLAMEVLVRSTARFDRAVLVDALGVKFGDTLSRDITDLHGLGQAEVRSCLYHRAERGEIDAADMTDDALARIARAREAFAYFGWKPYMHNPSLLRWLHRIDVPTLVVWGASDGFVTPDYGRKLAEAIPGARFETIAEAGHYPSVEQPAALSELIRDFADA
ncbi:MAG: alpha/beta hydrolase [Alphaproteobacteria bacterium]|nr:alpha/beta hydrolase [Alphaproteobacteria bacterium]